MYETEKAFEHPLNRAEKACGVGVGSHCKGRRTSFKSGGEVSKTHKAICREWILVFVHIKIDFGLPPKVLSDGP